MTRPPDESEAVSELPTALAAQPVGRRTLLRSTAVGGAALAAAALSGCGSATTDTAGGSSPTEPRPSDESHSSGGGNGGSKALGEVTDVPVGGGKIYASEQVVVTQPESGVFRGFSSICTHAGCPVTSVSATINCPCHGSQFSIADGSVVAGPAPQPLPAKDVTVSGQDIVLR